MSVIPAKAGTHLLPLEMGPRFREDDGVKFRQPSTSRRARPNRQSRSRTSTRAAFTRSPIPSFDDLSTFGRCAIADAGSSHVRNRQSRALPPRARWSARLSRTNRSHLRVSSPHVRRAGWAATAAGA